MINLRSRPHHTPPALTPGYGSERLSNSRVYFRGLNRPLLAGGTLLLFGALLVQLLPPGIRSYNVFNGFVAGSLGLYSLIGFLFLRTKFRISAPVFILALIQIWIAVTVFIGPQVFMTALKLGRNIWWPSFVLMPYFAAFLMVAIDPRFRERLFKFIYGVCIASAALAILQFVRFPGTYQLFTLYADVEYLSFHGLEMRSHGFTTHPFHLASQCILGCGLVTSNLLFRKLNAWEVALYALFSAGLVVAQSRTFYIAWALLTIYTLVLVFIRNKPQFLIICCIMGTIIVGLIFTFPEQLSYGLGGKNTIAEGRMNQWNRADELADQFPNTGIGPKETVFGSGAGYTDLMGRGRWYTLYTESGYRMSRVSGGYLGLTLLVSLVLSLITLAVRVFRDPTIEPIRRQAAFAGFYFAIALGIGLYITNIVESELLTYYGMALAAIVAPQVGEVYRSKRGRANVYFNRMAKARARMSLQSKPEQARPTP